MRRADSAGGFTIIEVLIAIVILAVGMLALATTSIFATTRVKLADLRTEQSVAVQQAVELLRSMPYDSIRARTYTNALSVNAYDVWWNVTPQGRFLNRVTLFTEGPGYDAGSGWVEAERDTFLVEIAETVPE